MVRVKFLRSSRGVLGPAGGGNAFRLGGRRPVYAPVPGLGTAPTPSAAAPVPAPAPAPAPAGEVLFGMATAQMVPPAGPPASSRPSSPPAFSPEPFNNGDIYQVQFGVWYGLV